MALRQDTTEKTELVFEKLDQLLKEARGKAAIKDFCDSIGRSRSWWYSHRSAKKPTRISQETVFAALRWAGVGVLEFYAMIDPRAPKEEKRPSSDTSQNLLLRHLETEATRQQSTLNDQQAERLIAEIDDLRYLDPPRGLQRVFEVAHLFPQLYYSSLFAAAGSCYRTLYDLGTALQCFDLAESFACNEYQFAEIKQRRTYCYFYGDIHLALRTILEAHHIFVRYNDSRKIAETLVDQAGVLYAYADYEGALQLFRSVFLHHFEAIGTRNRISTLQSIASILARLDRKAEATVWIAAAEQEALLEKSPYVLGHILWVKGLIHGCSKTLYEATKLLIDQRFLDAAQCAIDLCALPDASKNPQLIHRTIDEILEVAAEKLSVSVASIFEQIKAAFVLSRSIAWNEHRASIELARRLLYREAVSICSSNSLENSIRR